VREGVNVEQSDRVVVVTGVGGMGSAIAKRLGSGSTILVADVNPSALGVVAGELRADGYRER
jgi:NAD(P)-dependent dehydrogenase (short-subunit alcohol dehydrogenase family)